LDPQSIDIGPALTRWVDEKRAKQPLHRGKDVQGRLLTIDRQVLRFGISLGWQFGRYAFVYGSPFPEVQAAQLPIEAEISRALSRDGFQDSTMGMDYQQLMGSVLSYYSATSRGKHAAILIGISAMRASLVGVSKNEQHNGEMERLGFSAIAEIDPIIVSDKEGLYKAILKRKPKLVFNTSKM
jgi:hypothetical protein